jgi:hypothetical protein
VKHRQTTQTGIKEKPDRTLKLRVCVEIYRSKVKVACSSPDVGIDQSYECLRIRQYPPSATLLLTRMLIGLVSSRFVPAVKRKPAVGETKETLNGIISKATYAPKKTNSILEVLLIVGNFNNAVSSGVKWTESRKRREISAFEFRGKLLRLRLNSCKAQLLQSFYPCNEASSRMFDSF